VPHRADHGIFAVFEGIDGGGKTTQIRMLARELRRRGEEPVLSREPTSGPWGRKLRESAATGRMSLEEELDAFVRDRAEHVRDLILPSLDAGKIVILDRYFYSTLAYQGARGADVDSVRRLMEERFPLPDIVYLLDLTPEQAVQRISESRGDRPNEFERLDSLRKAREIFLSLEDARILRIDAFRDPAAVHADVVRAFPKRRA
jgi:dTMP kinase